MSDGTAQILLIVLVFLAVVLVVSRAETKD